MRRGGVPGANANANDSARATGRTARAPKPCSASTRPDFQPQAEGIREPWREPVAQREPPQAATARTAPEPTPAPPKPVPAERQARPERDAGANGSAPTSGRIARAAAQGGEKLKQLFRDAAAALRRTAPAPQPTKKKRRSGETGRAAAVSFRQAAQATSRRADLPRQDFAAAIAAAIAATLTAALTCIEDALDWLNFCHDAVGAQLEFEEDSNNHATTNYLSPHL